MSKTNTQHYECSDLEAWGEAEDHTKDQVSDVKASSTLLTTMCAARGRSRQNTQLGFHFISEPIRQLSLAVVQLRQCSSLLACNIYLVTCHYMPNDN